MWVIDTESVSAEAWLAVEDRRRLVSNGNTRGKPQDRLYHSRNGGLAIVGMLAELECPETIV